jgi:rhamnulose-1-phosphate aldolase/alcohol dehydrogenase
MRNRWSDDEAAAWVEHLGPEHGEAMALRVYTSRLIGSDPGLVLHGGGNTSLKATATTLVGDEVEVLHIKGSGWDLDRIEPAGLPAVRLEPLRRLRTLDALGDEEMVNQQRINLLDAGAPNPSIETLLHAFLPHRFVDHTHADVALVITNQPGERGEQLAREVFGERWGIVPYVMPGFALALAAAEVYEADPTVEGLVLLNHGLFTFADDARIAYERMVEAVDRAERAVAEMAGPLPEPAGNDAVAHACTLAAHLAPSLRGALASPTDDPDRPWRRVVLEHRADAQVLALLGAEGAADRATSNPLTPDHVIRTKGPALFLGESLPAEDDALRAHLKAEVGAYRSRYEAYVAARSDRAHGPITPLDPSPRVALVPGIGLFAAGPNVKEARVAADIAERTVPAKAQADAIGSYAGLDDGDLFDMEYWSLEQAKLGKGTPPRLAGQVALVTGAAGAIGFGTCQALVAAGAHVVVTDLDRARAEQAVVELDPKGSGVAVAVPMDVTDEASVEAALRQACLAYGGIDIVVLNAGVAHVAGIAELEPDAFRRVIEVNLEGTFLVLRKAAALLRRQGTGGHVIVNSSKNVFAPGAGFGAYSASKAGAHQLAKIAALELADAGVKVNLINADAVFGDSDRPSGLWQEVGPARAAAKGLEPEDLQEHYRRRNLLHAVVTPEHVGNAVVFFASDLTPTTGATLPVDGGIAEAFPR